MDIDELVDTSHRPLAPLASSETYSDVVGLTGDDQQQKQDIKTSSTTHEEKPSNEQSSRKTTKSEFDSLEILFDFPSSGISTNTHLTVEQSSQAVNHISFSHNDQIISADKVLDWLKFFYKYFYSTIGRTKKFTNWKNW